MRAIKYILPFIAFTSMAQQPTAMEEDFWFNNQWELTTGQEYEYNDEGLLVQQIHKYFYQPNTWMNDTKYVSEYNSSNKLVRKSYVHFNGSAWVDTAGYVELTYDGLGRETEQSYYHYSPWTIGSKVTLSYNGSSDKPATMTYQEWNDTSLMLENVHKMDYTYYTPGLTHEVLSIWQNENWQTIERCDKTYNSAGLLVQEYYEGYQNNTWETSSKSIYEYTAAGKLENSTLWFYNDSTNNFVPMNSIHWTFNADGTIDWQTSARFENNVWVNVSRFRFFYDGGLAIDEALDPEVQIFPNPCSDHLNVIIGSDQTVTLEVIDVQGRIWLTEEYEANQGIEVGDFPAGVYLLNLKGVESNQMIRFVKE